MGALLVTAQPAAFSSDWVEDTRTEFQLPPKPMPRPNYDQVLPPDDIPSVGVTDHGHVLPPERPVHTAALQGNVQQERANINPQQLGTGISTGIGPSGFFPPEIKAAVLEDLVPPATRVVSPKVYSAWLTETHPNIGAMTRASIIEVKGQWDDSGHALQSFGFSHDKVSTNQLAKTPLDGTDVLIVDCAGDVPPAGLEAINKFVKNGGWLITTDWALDACLSRAIPGYVEWNNAYSSSEIIDAHINPDAPADLLKNTVSKAYWKLDKLCQIVRVIKTKEVEVIAYSNRLRREDPNGIGILACTFNYGKGRVLHLVGHFDHNTDRAFNNALPDPAPKIGISLRQAIVANFIAAALEAHPRPVPVKK